MEKLLYERANNFIFQKDIEEHCLKFLLDGYHIGFVGKDYVSVLQEFGKDVFVFSDKTVTLNPKLKGIQDRGEAVEDVMIKIRDSGVIPHFRGWRNEKYNVIVPRKLTVLFQLERTACSILGVIKFGCHINGYTERDGIKYMWIGVRSMNKPTYPGMLDNMAAGGLNCEMTQLECAINECEEEAGVTQDYSREHLRPCGAVSCFFGDEFALNPEIEYVFDLKLPPDFTPKNQDGEVGRFQLVPFCDLLKLVQDTNFKVTSALVVVDFMIRHGVITADTKDLGMSYAEIINMIHVQHGYDFSR